MYGLIKKANRLDSPLEALSRDLWNQFFDPNEEGSSAYAPRIKLSEDKDNYYILAEMPGVKQDDIEVTYNDGILSLNAHSTADDEKREGETVIFNEHREYRYSRSFRLPKADPEKADAKLEDGVLKMTVGKSEESKPRRIAIG